MNGHEFILDTNIVLYIIGGKLDLNSIPEGYFLISVITELELLSYPKISIDEEKLIKQFISDSEIINLDSPIKDKAITLRKKYSLKLPDAIICATAWHQNSALITNDKELSKIDEIDILIP